MIFVQARRREKQNPIVFWVLFVVLQSKQSLPGYSEERYTAISPTFELYRGSTGDFVELTFVSVSWVIRLDQMISIYEVEFAGRTNFITVS